MVGIFYYKSAFIYLILLIFVYQRAFNIRILVFWVISILDLSKTETILFSGDLDQNISTRLKFLGLVKVFKKLKLQLCFSSC